MLPLVKTRKGTRIIRPAQGVGKIVGPQIYVHRDYVFDALPKKNKSENVEIIKEAHEILKEKHPKHEFRTIMFDTKKKLVRFDEAPDFNDVTEPMPGRMVTVFPDGTTKEAYSRFIWHHKWLWVKKDYKGFGKNGVERAHIWSHIWAKHVEGVAKGNKAGFKQQLIDATKRLPLNNPERKVIMEVLGRFYK